MVGCHIITAPLDLIKKLSGINRDLNELSLDTVRTFKKDAEAAGFSL
jgi:transaldolase